MNTTVTQFLDTLNHPYRAEIQALRLIILNCNKALMENIKWNGPNYSIDNEDRITMSIQPPKQIRIVFHCGAKVKAMPIQKLIKNDFGILEWKGNDRAVATFKSMKEIENQQVNLTSIVLEWLKATAE
jgi:hypothetical protein